MLTAEYMLYTDTDYKNIISEFKSRRDKNPDLHIQYVRSLKQNFNEVIIAATIALDQHGEKHIHQSRMSNGRLRKFAQKLCVHSNELQRANTFEDIYQIVCTVRVFGLGAVVYYDTSLRIASTKDNCLPDRIYLFSRTLKGAKNIGVDTKGKAVLFKEELPTALAKSDLNCAELTDLLSCYFAEGKWGYSLEFV